MDAVVEVENDNIRIVPRIFQQLVMKYELLKMIYWASLKVLAIVF